MAVLEGPRFLMSEVSHVWTTWHARGSTGSELLELLEVY